MTQQHVLVVFTDPVEGREADFNEWQDKVHVPDVLTIPGYLSAQRYKLSNAQFSTSGQQRSRYMTVYQIETDDLAGVFAEAGQRMASMRFTDALQMETISTKA